jgi:hypothetical protein
MRRKSSSRNRRTASEASHRRAADSTNVSSTDWRSVGELAIARRMSAVAVCCWSASVNCFCNSATLGARSRSQFVTERPHLLAAASISHFTAGCNGSSHARPRPRTSIIPAKTSLAEGATGDKTGVATQGSAAIGAKLTSAPKSNDMQRASSTIRHDDDSKPTGTFPAHSACASHRTRSISSPRH